MLDKQQKSVLIIEDIETAAATIKETFEQDAEHFSFTVSACSSVEMYVEKYEDRSFDVFVIDLQLDNFPEERFPIEHTYAGNLIVELASNQSRRAIVAVFSAHRGTEDICHTMRMGADIFVPKDLPNSFARLLSDVERELVEKEGRQDKQEKTIEFLESNPSIAEEHSGKYVVVVDGSVVVSENSNLRALIKYRDWVANSPESAPFFPTIIEVL